MKDVPFYLGVVVGIILLTPYYLARWTIARSLSTIRRPVTSASASLARKP